MLVKEVMCSVPSGRNASAEKVVPSNLVLFSSGSMKKKNKGVLWIVLERKIYIDVVVPVEEMM